MSQRLPYGSRHRSAAAPSRACGVRPEWERAVYRSELPLPGIAVVLCLGSFATWPGGFEARPRLERLVAELDGKISEDRAGRWLSTAVRLGLLHPTRAPFDGHPTVYRCTVPTGEPSSAGYLPLEGLEDASAPRATRSPVHSPVDSESTPGVSAGCDQATPGDPAVEHPAIPPSNTRRYRRPTPPTDHTQTTGTSPLPPSRGPVLLGVVDGGGQDPARRGDLRPAADAERVALVARGLIAGLPSDLPPLHRRWAQPVAANVGRLLAGGWSVADVAAAVLEPSWTGVVNPGAVLRSRLQDLPDQAPAGCTSCDRAQLVRAADGELVPCPRCHPVGRRRASGSLSPF